VTDAAGCFTNAPLRIKGVEALELGVSASSGNCQGTGSGSIALSITGGVYPFTTDWADLYGNSNPKDRSGLAPGLYTVTVTGANGCTASISAGIYNPQPFAATATTRPACGGKTGSIQLNVTGGVTDYNFNWADIPGNFDPADRTDLAAGTYTVTINDERGCVLVKTVTVAGVAQPFTLIWEGYTYRCSDIGFANKGTRPIVLLSGQPPIAYTWETPAYNPSNQPWLTIAPGTYYATVTDAVGCTITVKHLVEDIAPIEVIPSITPATCNMANGSIALSVSGGVSAFSGAFKYQWTDNQTLNTSSRQGLAAGFYNINISNGVCKIGRSYQLTQNCNANDPAQERSGEAERSISIRPNPTQDAFYIQLPASGQYWIEVFDALGKRVYRNEHTAQATLDVRVWPVGSYFVKVASISEPVEKPVWLKAVVER
jgi:Secretion system C-terminal sorting domain/SprB repeat